MIIVVIFKKINCASRFFAHLFPSTTAWDPLDMWQERKMASRQK